MCCLLSPTVGNLVRCLYKGQYMWGRLHLFWLSISSHINGNLFAAGNATRYRHQLRGMAAKQLLELYRDVPQIPSAGALQHEGKGLPNLVIRRRLCDFKMYEGYESLMMNTELCWFPTVYVFFRTDLKSLDTDISIYISDLSDCFAFQG